MKLDVLHFQKILIIDTTSTEATNLAILEPNRSTVLKRPVKAQELQTMMVELLSRARIDISHIAAVAVLVGPGSYTGTRMGVTAANTLAWLSNIPVIEIPGSDFDRSLSAILAGEEFKVVKQATARY